MNEMTRPKSSRARERGEFLIEVRDLQVTYNRMALGVESVSLGAAAGEIAVIIGANGAGKTTTLRAMSGFIPSEGAAISGGEIFYEGRSIVRMSPQARVRRGLSLIPQEDKIFRRLTVSENLHVGWRRRGGDPDREDFLYDLFPPLAERRGQLAGYLSGGERQMLAIGAALMLEPDVLLADEISMGVAPILVTTLLEALREINRVHETTVILVEQNAQALQIADYVYTMENGTVSAEGSPEYIASQESAVVDAYLGRSASHANRRDAATMHKGDLL